MPKDWWKTFFDENYLLFWGARGFFRHTKKEVEFLVKHVPIKKSDRVLDLCCGHGRHSLELARRGFGVTGLDYSAYELELAREAAAKKHLPVRFVRGDARNFRLPQKYDVIINMFTAFGYGSREDDAAILRNASRHLKRGGRFFIDLMSVIWIFRNFQAKHTERLGKNSYARIIRSFDFVQNINYENRTIFKDGKRQTRNLKLQFYSLPEIIVALEAAGLWYEKSWGSFDGKPYGLDSRRMIVLARKT